MTIRTIKLSSDELQSVESVLARLTADAAPAQLADCSKPNLLRAARLMLGVRRARSRFLHRSMLGEAAYDMLLALYACPDDKGMTGARLAEVSGVPQSSGLRWLEYLIGQDLVVRSPHPTDKRASLIDLTDRGRTALDQVAREMCEGLHAFDR